jgi:hypothetical protein
MNVWDVNERVGGHFNNVFQFPTYVMYIYRVGLIYTIKPGKDEHFLLDKCDWPTTQILRQKKNLKLDIFNVTMIFSIIHVCINISFIYLAK